MEKLENVKVGDKLIISRPWCTDYIDTVERMTKTLVVTSNGYKFKKANGYGYQIQGCAWPATPEDIERVKLKEKHISLVYDCGNINFKKLSIPQMEEIIRIASTENEI